MTKQLGDPFGTIVLDNEMMLDVQGYNTLAIWCVGTGATNGRVAIDAVLTIDENNELFDEIAITDPASNGDHVLLRVDISGFNRIRSRLIGDSDGYITGHADLEV